MSLSLLGRVRMGAVSIVIILAFVLAGCGSSSSSGTTSSTSSGNSAGTTGLQDVYFVLNWLPNVEFAGLWVAQQKGWWKQAGLRMNYKGWAPGVSPETEVPARPGNVFGFQSGAAIAIAASKNVPLKALYTDTQNSVFGLTVLKSSGITDLKQLKGKRVGYQSHELYVPSTMLSCVGLSDTDWKPVEVGFDPSVLITHQVDAYLTFLTNEPIALKLQGIPTTSFAAKDNCFHFYDDVMFTSTGLIKKNPDVVKKVTEVVAKGFRWAHEHPVEAARITVQNYFPASQAGKQAGKNVSAAQNLQQQTLEIQAFEPFSKGPNGDYPGTMTTDTWKSTIDTLYKYKEITSKPDAAQIYTNEYNPYR